MNVATLKKNEGYIPVFLFSKNIANY